jgi:hypothetical protein
MQLSEDRALLCIVLAWFEVVAQCECKTCGTVYSAVFMPSSIISVGGERTGVREGMPCVLYAVTRAALTRAIALCES